MVDSQRTSDVHVLRAQGLAPKQIARRLGMRPTEVLGVLNRPVTENPGAGRRAPDVRCWVSSSWGKELRVNGHSEWPGGDDDSAAPGGVVCVLVARGIATTRSRSAATSSTSTVSASRTRWVRA